MLRIFRLKIILLLLLFLSELESVAQFDNIRFSKLPGENLANSWVNDMCQDSQGYIWLGTNNGLIKYNGYETIKHDRENNKGGDLKNNSVKQVIELNDGNLLIGTNIGLYVFSKERLTFKRIDLTIGDTGEQSEKIRKIYQDSKKRLWIATNRRHLFLLDSTFRVMSAWPSAKERAENSKVRYNVNAIFEDSNQNVWFSRGNFLSRYGKNGKEIKNFFTGNLSFPGKQILTVSQSKTRDNFLVGFKNAGMCLIKIDLDGLPELIRRVPLVQEGSGRQLWDYKAESILVDHAKRVWVSDKENGLYVIDLSTFKTKKFTFNKENLAGLPGKQILTFMEDRDRSIWISVATKGVCIVHNYEDRFVHFKNQPISSYSLHNNIAGMFVENDSGDVWIGTQEGVSLFDVNKEKFTAFDANRAPPGNSMSVSQVCLWMTMIIYGWVPGRMDCISSPLRGLKK